MLSGTADRTRFSGCKLLCQNPRLPVQEAPVFPVVMVMKAVFFFRGPFVFTLGFLKFCLQGIPLPLFFESGFQTFQAIPAPMKLVFRLLAFRLRIADGSLLFPSLFKGFLQTMDGCFETASLFFSFRDFLIGSLFFPLLFFQFAVTGHLASHVRDSRAQRLPLGDSLLFTFQIFFLFLKGSFFL